MNNLMKSKGKKPRTGEVRECETCHKEMYVRPSEVATRRFCSYACANNHKRHQRARQCPQCSRIFNKPEGDTDRYCSRACYEQSRIPQHVCEICGAALQTSARRFCSLACYQQRPRIRVERTCEVCGAMMQVKPSELATKKYCSRACRVESIRLPGPGHKAVRMDGYISVYYPTHPDADGQGRVLEHRLVAEQKYGRRLTSAEQVHHLNGNRTDNRPENLEIVEAAAHTRITNARSKQARREQRAELAAYRAKYGPLEKDEIA